MKCRIFLLLLALILALCAAAAADPALTDGVFTAWIGADGRLFYKPDGQAMYRSDVIVNDLLSAEGDVLYLLERGGQVLALRKDGSRLTVYNSEPTDADLEALREARYSLLEGDLTVGGKALSSTAAAAACDGTFIYWAEADGTGWRLRQDFMNIQPLQYVFKLPLDGQTIPEPQALSVTGEGLALTAADHSIVCFNLDNGQKTVYPAVGENTEQAVIAGGKLLRYALGENGAWEPESEEVLTTALSPDVTFSPGTLVTPTATPVTTPVPTLIPTATPRPTNTPRPTKTPRPTATPRPDNRICLGDKGQEVRNMQERLDSLGYPVGKIDGIYGQGTQKAVSLFQAAIHSAEKNYMSENDLKKLYAPDAPEYDAYMPLQQGDSGVNVRTMQQRLQDLGYDPQKIDGKYGTMTVRAVALFQEATGIGPESGEAAGTRASRRLLQKLYSDTAPTRKITVSGGVYRLSGSSAVLIGPSSRGVKTITIPDYIEAEGKRFPVTTIEKGACKKLENLSRLYIGENVKRIGNSAFYGCSKLKKISVQTRLLNEDGMGTQVFSGVPEDAVVTCPEDLAKAYRKLFRDSGLPKSVKFNPD